MYRITDYTKQKAKELNVTVKQSTNKNKKIDVYKNNEKHEPYTKDSLNLAKELLKTHIDFIIMENYTDYTTAGAIASLMNANQKDIARLSSNLHHGGSKWAPHTNNYRDLLPSSVVKYLESEKHILYLEEKINKYNSI